MAASILRSLFRSLRIHSSFRDLYLSSILLRSFRVRSSHSPFQRSQKSHISAFHHFTFDGVEEIMTSRPYGIEVREGDHFEGPPAMVDLPHHVFLTTLAPLLYPASFFSEMIQRTTLARSTHRTILIALSICARKISTGICWSAKQTL